LLAPKWVDCWFDPRKQYGRARAQKPLTQGSMK
jgi:endonuclease YncB( thermonuclease family)